MIYRAEAALLNLTVCDKSTPGSKAGIRADFIPALGFDGEAAGNLGPGAALTDATRAAQGKSTTRWMRLPPKSLARPRYAPLRIELVMISSGPL